MTEKKRIAFVCHPYHRGGVTRWMADAAIAAAAGGHEVYFVTVEPQQVFFSGKGRETMLQLLGKELNTVRIIKTKVGSEFEFGTPEYRAYVYEKLITKLPLGTPLILSDDGVIWDAATSLRYSYFITGVLHSDEGHYYGLAERYAAKTDIFVCVSNRVGISVEKLIPDFGPNRVFTIPCGINLPHIEYNNEPSSLLRLVYVGRLSDYQKRTGDLVTLCGLLAKRGIKFHLDIIGDGDTKASLEQEFTEAGLQQYVTFWGWLSQKEVARHLSASDVLVLTSDFEGTPIAMMEALASGCGFTGTRVSGIEDYEFHPLAADCLSVYAIGDIEDAVNKIMCVAAIPRSTRQKAARKLAEAEFSMKVCLEKYFNIIYEKKSPVPPLPIKLSFFALLYSKALAMARHLKVGKLGSGGVGELRS